MKLSFFKCRSILPQSICLTLQSCLLLNWQSKTWMYIVSQTDFKWKKRSFVVINVKRNFLDVFKCEYGSMVLQSGVFCQDEPKKMSISNHELRCNRPIRRYYIGNFELASVIELLAVYTCVVNIKCLSYEFQLFFSGHFWNNSINRNECNAACFATI